jgi:hypothetical protein
VTSSLNTNLSPSTDNDHTLGGLKQATPARICTTRARDFYYYPMQSMQYYVSDPGVLSYLSLFRSKTYGSSFSEKRLINKILPYLALDFFGLFHS